METAEAHAIEAAEGDQASGFIEHLASRIGGQATVRAVFGESVEQGAVTVIPVARVRWGVGGGGGASPEGSGVGGGGGVTAEPVGYIEVTSAGAIFRPLPRTIGPAQLIGAAVAVAIVIRAVARLRR